MLNTSGPKKQAADKPPTSLFDPKWLKSKWLCCHLNIKYSYIITHNVSTYMRLTVGFGHEPTFKQRTFNSTAFLLWVNEAQVKSAPIFLNN
jgi:hypothetical protein